MNVVDISKGLQKLAVRGPCPCYGGMADPYKHAIPDMGRLSEFGLSRLNDMVDGPKKLCAKAQSPCLLA